MDIGVVVDSKYLVDGLCSDGGGMGTVLFVRPLHQSFGFPVVLKYCKATDDDSLRRFRREVRLLEGFAGNSKVVQIVDSNLEHEPPYFVMKYYPDGDVGHHADVLRAAPAALEQAALQMIAAVHELHAKGQLHRDIKPANFLRDGEGIVVSDLGLSTEPGSATAFTATASAWGTEHYFPPEFLTGGFKHADAAGDVFMMGKTLYALASGRPPMYLLAQGLPAPLFHVIQRACSYDKSQRYASMPDLAQAIVTAFDVILGRGGGVGQVRQLLAAILDRLARDHSYDVGVVLQFVEQLALIDPADQRRVCADLPAPVFSLLAQRATAAGLVTFLGIYEGFVEAQDYSWAYAEIIATRMQAIFQAQDIDASLRARALDLAIRAARCMNRYAAMDTCRAMIAGVSDEQLGLEVAAVITAHSDSFLDDMEPSQCRSRTVAAAIASIR